LAALAQEAPRITKEELKEMLGNPDVIIIDYGLVETGKQRAKNRGSIKRRSGNLNSWLSKFPKKRLCSLLCLT